MDSTLNKHELLRAIDALESTLQRRFGEHPAWQSELEQGLALTGAIRNAAERGFAADRAPSHEQTALELALQEIQRQPRREHIFDPQPVFLIGCKRSGTTLLSWLLDSHPNIAAIPENALCHAFFHSGFHNTSFMNTRGSSHLQHLMYACISVQRTLHEQRHVFLARCAQLVSDVFLAYAQRVGKPRWVSKEVLMAHSLDFLDLAFDFQPRYIYLVRHGLDSAFSMSERFNFLGRPAVYGGLGLRAYLEEWCETNEASLDFVARNKDRSCILKYEDLVADTAGVGRQLMAFMNEEWSDAIMDNMQQQSHTRVGGDSKIVATGGRVDRSRIGRWRSWPPELIRELGRVANPMLVRLGYEPV